VLAFTGGAAGLLVAIGGSAAFRLLAPDIPRLQDAALNTRVLLYTIASAVIVALLCGLMPALHSTRGTLVGGRTQVSHRHSLQWLLVGVQITLAVTLLTGAGLLLRSFDKLSRVERGFDASHVLTFRVSASFGEERDYIRTVQRINRTLDALKALPGIEAAATTLSLSGVQGHVQLEFRLAEGRGASDPPMIADAWVVSPDYFEAMQIPLLSGERCRPTTTAGGTTEVLVNRSFAERYLAGRSAIGLHLAATTPDRIVGIVGDARERGLDHTPVPTVYSCFSAATPSPWFIVRTSREPSAIAADIRRTINRLEPQRSVYDVAPLDDRIGHAYAHNRLRTLVLVLFACAALSLACLGVYGTLSYIVSLRRREVGLRLALGAARSGILRQFVGQSLRVAATACACGLAFSIALTGLLSGMLYGVTRFDPTTLAAVVLVVLTVATLASLVPASRAAFVQPMRALREE
jgi:putative ABC transport system permease protein